MARNLTPAEVEAQYVECMGAELGYLINRLQAECTLLNSTWGQFTELFATSEERIDVLRWSGSHFFSVVREIFLESTVLRICKLTDPAKMGRNGNVSLARLTYLVDTAIRGEVERLVEQITSSSSFARDWRNRHIAHHDFALTFDESAKPLAPMTKQMISDVIASIGNLLNKVVRHYSESEIDFERLIAPGQADDLLQVLNESFQEEREFRSRLEKNQLTAEDVLRVPRKRI